MIESLYESEQGLQKLIDTCLARPRWSALLVGYNQRHVRRAFHALVDVLSNHSYAASFPQRLVRFPNGSIIRIAAETEPYHHFYGLKLHQLDYYSYATNPELYLFLQTRIWSYKELSGYAIEQLEDEEKHGTRR